MNYILKGALVEKFGSQCAAARALGLREWRLSRIVRGWDAPRCDELETFSRVLGQAVVDKAFEGGGSNELR